jgi:hypothetical protein
LKIGGFFIYFSKFCITVLKTYSLSNGQNCQANIFSMYAATWQS